MEIFICKTSIITIVKELKSNTIFILILLHASFYNDQLHKNDVLFIKTALYKQKKLLMNKEEEQRILIIDNVYYNINLTQNDVIDDNKSDDIDVDKLKEKGNKYFGCKQYLFAINCYSKALQSNNINDDKDLKLKLLCNRSLCFLYVNEYCPALIDAENALKIDKHCIKAKFRCIKALNGIGKYLKAIKILKSIDKTTIESKSICKSFGALEQEIVMKYYESMAIFKNDKNEKIDFALYPLFSHPIKWKNVSNFINNKISIKYINKTKGRGIIATNDIKCGEIILIEKVFAKSELLSDSKYHISKRDSLLMSVLKNTFPYLRIKGGFEYNSNLNCKRISFLYNGISNCIDHKNNDHRNLKYKVPNIDLFKYNECDDDDTSNAMTVNDIQGVIDCNSFESLIDPNDIDLIEAKYTNNCNNNDKTDIDNKMYQGLFCLVSFMNHNDNPNCYHIIWYNTFIVIADKNIKKNEEICISYLNPWMSDVQRNNQMSWMGIQ